MRLIEQYFDIVNASKYGQFYNFPLKACSLGMSNLIKNILKTYLACSNYLILIFPIFKPRIILWILLFPEYLLLKSFFLSLVHWASLKTNKQKNLFILSSRLDTLLRFQTKAQEMGQYRVWQCVDWKWHNVRGPTFLSSMVI